MKSVIALTLAFLATPAFAGTHKFSCTTDAFPVGIGSTLDLTIDDNGALTEDALLTLHDADPAFGSGTNGYFWGRGPIPNEDGTPVTYLKWGAGAGLGKDGGEHLKLIPMTMALYDFQRNYEHSKSAFVGVIHWELNQKIEDHYDYQCKTLPVSPSVSALTLDFGPNSCESYSAESCPANCDIKEYRISKCVSKQP